MERYLRPSEVARILKLNTETVYHYIKKGDLPAARLGRKYIVTEKDLERFIQRGKEAYRVEKLEFSKKGKEMVEQVRVNAERVCDFIGEFPGATKGEIKEALEIEDKDIDRALTRLETKGQVHSEEGADQAEALEAMWYTGHRREVAPA
jgi:excisionase family DNA binding protein